MPKTHTPHTEAGVFSSCSCYQSLFINSGMLKTSQDLQLLEFESQNKGRAKPMLTKTGLRLD